MKTYINLRDSQKSHANRALGMLGAFLDADTVDREKIQPMDCDLLIQWGFKPTVSLLEQIRRGKPYVIFDLGYFDKLGLNGGRRARFSLSINGFHGTAWRDPVVHRRPQRPAPTFEKWKPAGEGKRVLVCGQMPYDQSLRGHDVDAWQGRAAIEAAEKFGLPVQKRVHPKMLNPWEDPIPPLDRALEDCEVCVTFNSTAGINAILRGVPTVAMHPGSMALPIASPTMEIIRPDSASRVRWLHELSWREWDWRNHDLKLLAEYLTETYPLYSEAPLDSPRIMV